MTQQATSGDTPQMEILFYHLEQRSLEQVLPLLLEKTLERGWRALVEVGSDACAQSLDAALWTWRDDSFLPHGVSGTEADHLQPILVTTGTDNPNGANIRFFADGTVPRVDGDYLRLVYLFSGHDSAALDAARQAWKTLSKSHPCTYWQQSDEGRWVKKA